MSCGCTRVVLLVGRYAFKFPNWRYSWRNFLNGLLCNMQEIEFATTKWPELCPIVFSIHGGWLVIMKRARVMTDSEFEGFDATEFIREKHLPVELKADSFGFLDGRVVAVDYGS